MPSNLTGSNSTALFTDTQHNFAALIFGILLIIIIICGNVLVCISVYKEKALKTTTNYFIVSLAVADLLLAVLVLPLFVYAQFQDGVWSLNMRICDALMAMDVMLCTASIFNLCAISVDRFIAVLVPLNYNRRHVDQRQVGLLVGTWVLALAVASPVVFGINDVPGRSQRECRLENENYIIYSSVCSFFIPCPLMLLLYCGIFRGLRRWEESRKAKLRGSIQTSLKLQEAAASLTSPLVDTTSPTSPLADTTSLTSPLDETASPMFPLADSFTPSIHEITLENSHPTIEHDVTLENSDAALEHEVTLENQHPTVERDATHSAVVCRITHKNFPHHTDCESHTHVNLHTAELMSVDLSPVQKHTLTELGPVEEHTHTELGPVEKHTLTELGPVEEHTLLELKVEKLDQVVECGSELVQAGRLRLDSMSQAVPAVAQRYPNLKLNTHTHTNTHTHSHTHSQKQQQGCSSSKAKINRRERKAMRVLPVVVGAFLFCWTPFFVVHTLRAMCESCAVPQELMSTVTWLGYVNSAVNPVIYTAFNTEFRRFFKRFLSCWR